MSQPADTYLARLERLCERRIRYAPLLNDKGFLLLDHCIIATYQDCVTFGAKEQASDIYGQFVLTLAAGVRE